jgi:hypothetical protein
MEREEETKVTPAVEPEAEPVAKDTVTVTAKEDCSLLIDGVSVTLAAGDTAEMTPSEAAAYANLGLVELSGKAERAVPKRR